jgi:glycosyltransferase involved in cell wall biosynthesis
MGADLEGSKPSQGLPSDADHVIKILQSRPTFLSVSTLEPRKAQVQIFDAVELLWARGDDINLVLVGQQGWKIETLVDRIAKHPENGKRLFWLKGISDEYLDHVYKNSTCLVAASINEGFGLPLIEAARHGIPIIARDVPVFREVAGHSAFYFRAETGDQLAAAMSEWLQRHQQGSAPPSTGMRWLTWQQSTEQLKRALVERHYPRRQLLVDISELVQRDARTGIQRVVRSVLREWLLNPPDGFRVEPVFATVDQPYCYARQFTARFLDSTAENLVDEPIDFQPGDVFFALDLNHHVPRVHKNFLQSMYQAGVDVQFLVYDLLPIQFPQFWEPQHSVHLVVEEWMNVVAGLGGAVCISKAVADDFLTWMSNGSITRKRKFNLNWFHLGADTTNSVPSKGLPEEAGSVLSSIKKSPSFLMVGTLEPRKGNLQVLDAFEKLWHRGSDVNLVVVGKQGWMVEALIDRLHNHEELGKRLFWLEGISDEYLEKVYAASTCLIAASYGEGFGLPLIEAAQQKLPIIARDIPVFREVAGEHAFYFQADHPAELAQALQAWLALYQTEQHPKSDHMPWLTWKESAQQLLKAMNIISSNKINQALTS